MDTYTHTHLLTSNGGTWCGFLNGWVTADPHRCTCASCIDQVHEHADCCGADSLAKKLTEQTH